MHIDWDSEQTHLLMNPRMPEQDQLSLLELPHLPGHIWIATSGTEALKYVALSKQAILRSAESVNLHLGIDKKDTWIHVLPDFHVGGIGIWARSHLSGSKVIKLPLWNPEAFLQSVQEQSATLASLVPAQIFDLVKYNLKAPDSMRAVIVGGGALSETLFHQAKALNWPLVPTYGMTECASQVATATPSDPRLCILSHVELRVDSEEFIHIQSPSLLTGYALRRKDNIEFLDPKTNGWFSSEDRGMLSHRILTVYGRNSHFVKIGGESVNLQKLNQILDEIKISISWTYDAAISVAEDERLGKTIQLVTTSEFEVGRLIEQYNNRVHPYEKIRSFQLVDSIPKTVLMKYKL